MNNTGAAGSAATTLRYYRSTDATITTSDTSVGTDAVGALAASGSSGESISLTAPSTPGTYYYGACVDTVTDESDTTNNCSTAASVDAVSPDLEVGTPTVSDAGPAAGGSFTLSATVSNTGAAGSAATTLRYYRSTDATITTSDTEEDTDAVGPLAASGTSSESISLTAPSTAGTYYYGACVDTVTDESDTTNNCSASVTVVVGASQAPDLEVGTPTVSNAGPQTGGSFTLSATVSNTGAGESVATTLRYYRSTDATITTSDTSVGTVAVGALAASRSSGESISLTAPSTAGTYYYGACVDAVADESDTTDNCSASATVVVSEPRAGSPNLVVMTPTVSDAGPQTGGSFTLSVSVRNYGDGGVSAATTLRVYRSTDATIWITTSDTSVGTDAVGPLAVLGSSRKTISLTAPSTAGTYYYGACVDAVAGESDTTDNCSLSVRVDVGAQSPDLIVSTSFEYGSAEDRTFSIIARVDNQGAGGSAATTLRYYRSADATITTSDFLLSVRPLGAIAASEYRLGGASNIPLTDAPYYYAACVEAVAGESDTTNNCSTPVRVGVGATQPPDLEVGTPTVSDAAPWWEQDISLSATVSNTGVASARLTTLRYYRSTDATITSSDTEVGTDTIGALLASGTSSETITISLGPSRLMGTYYYGACVDAVTDESDTTNNCSTGVRVDILSPKPVFGTPTVSDAAPPPGGSFRLSITVTNAGTARYPTTQLNYFSATHPITLDKDFIAQGVDVIEELVVCPLNKLTLDLRGVSTVRAGIAVRRPVRPRASNRKIISGTYH